MELVWWGLGLLVVVWIAIALVVAWNAARS
jgi:hypothetical protein